MLGALNRLVFNRHVGRGRPETPEAHESLPSEERAGTSICASHPERGRRPGAASEQPDQRGRPGSRSERGEEGTAAYHGDPGAGLSSPSGQFTPHDLQLLRGYEDSLPGCGLGQLFERTPTHLINSGHGHQPYVTRRELDISVGSAAREGASLKTAGRGSTSSMPNWYCSMTAAERAERSSRGKV